MNQNTIDLATHILSGYFNQDDQLNVAEMNETHFPYVANQFLDYFYDCNQVGATDYEILRDRCKLMAMALDDVIDVYNTSNS